MKSDQKLNHIFSGLVIFDHFLHFVAGVFFLFWLYIPKKTFLTAAFFWSKVSFRNNPWDKGLDKKTLTRRAKETLATRGKKSLP